MKKRFIFVSGCPRSGTTVLTTMLNWGDDVFIGQERFAGIFKKDPGSLVPKLFGADQLPEFFRRSFKTKPVYSSKVGRLKDHDEIKSCTVAGDKIPALASSLNVFESVPWKDEDVTVIYIVRNFQDVAASYRARNENPDDKWARGQDEAIEDWKASIVGIHQFLQAEHSNTRVGIVDYDALFGDDLADFLAHARSIYGFAGLDFGETQRKGLGKLFRVSQKRKDRWETLRTPANELPIAPEVLAKYEELVARAIKPRQRKKPV